MSATIGGGEPTRPANIRPLEFWKEYEPRGDGDAQEVHWVRWAKIGDFHYNAQIEKVSRIMRPRRSEGGIEEFGPIWLAIQPHYDAWIKGQEAPVFGTPLDAWSSLTKRQVRAFQDVGIRSVEEIAAINDNEIPRIRIPDVRRIRNLARAFEENKKGSAHVEAELAKRDSEIDQLKALVADMQAALKAMPAPQAEASA
jgi:hypothetical protein